MRSLLLFFQILLLTPLTTSLRLPLTFTQPSLNPTNSTSRLFLLHLPTTNNPTTHCTTNPYWHLPTLNPTDCQDALTKMYLSTVFLYGDESFEFVSPGVDPHHSITVMQTPRRYASGTCVVAIAMLATFSPGELPGARPVRYHETDVGSFQSLWEGAKGVDGECVGRGGGPMSGWRVDGGRNSIGIFIWSARSPIDIRHFPRVPGGDGISA